MVGCAVVALVPAKMALPAYSGNLDFVLTQRSTRMGDQYVYIAPEGWRMTNPHSGVTIVSRGPDWQITLFNAQSHVYYEMTPEQWARGAAAEHGYEEWPQGAHWVKKGQVNICGMQASQYEISGAMRKHDSNGHVFPSDIVKAKFVIAEGYPINPKLTKLMKEAYNFPTLAGIPLRLVYISDKGEQRPVVDTYRIDRTALTAVVFNRPSGLRKVDNEVEVMIDPQQQSMLKKMATDMDPANAALLNKVRQEINKGAFSNRVNVQSGGGQTARLSPEEVQALLEKYRREQVGK